jgi:hypothetical protein
MGEWSRGAGQCAGAGVWVCGCLLPRLCPLLPLLFSSLPDEAAGVSDEHWLAVVCSDEGGQAELLDRLTPEQHLEGG